MMYAADFRKQAYEKLGSKWTSGKWATYALITLIYAAIIGVCGLLTYICIGAVAAILVVGPLSFGLAVVSLRVMRSRDINAGTLFCGFKQFGRTFVASLLIEIFTMLWALLFIIPGIVMSYAYSMTFYILADNPQMSPNEARKKSIELMRGNKWRLFCLHFSFLGWMLLCCLTFGILEFWVMPYMQTAQAAFYEEISKNAGIAPAADSPAAPTENVTSGYAPVRGTAKRVACTECGTVNSGEAKFCVTCGKKLGGLRCPSCGAVNDEGTKFCTKCGSKLTGLKCPSCGAVNDEGTKFCTECGSKLTGLKCPSCGAVNDEKTKFCTKCGTKLEAGKLCPDCGARNADNAKFCQSCGKKLDDATITKSGAAGVCPDCGTRNDADTRFCIHCGKKLK